MTVFLLAPGLRDVGLELVSSLLRHFREEHFMVILFSLPREPEMEAGPFLTRIPGATQLTRRTHSLLALKLGGWGTFRRSVACVSCSVLFGSRSAD